ncbi:MAG: diguanylate cyclase [Acetatifactor sp.]
MRKHKSIRGKLLGMILLIVLLFSVTMGIISVFDISEMSKEDSRLLMNQICDRETLRFDNKLNLVEHSVNMITNYANQEMEWYGENYIYTAECERQIRDLTTSIADGTDGAVAVYFRYNPEIVEDGKRGFLWSYDSEKKKFVEEVPTDILEYAETDVEHVGWFYIPKETRKPLWMTPYYNKNLDFFMISYVVPIYLNNGEFVGVIGMDIDFDKMMVSLGKTKIYATGRVGLVDLSERFIYYLGADNKTETHQLDITLYNHITTINKENELLEYTGADGRQELLCYSLLSNGMRLFVSAHSDEINENRDSLMRQYIIISLCAMLVTFLLISKLTDKIIDPIKKLANVTNRYARGDWTQQYVLESGDEIEELSVSIAEMARKTQSYIEHIKYDARRDALTGLRNNKYYRECVERIKESAGDETENYGVVVFDLNLLKKANDTYGHEVGDILLKAAARYIGECFKKSLAFRIGGDEFVVLLKGEELKNHVRLLEQFDKGLNFEVPGAHGIVLSIASGFAQYGPDGKDYEEVFQVADARMYDKKCSMKMERRDVQK